MTGTSPLPPPVPVTAFRAVISATLFANWKIALRLLKLVDQSLRDPFDGPGKPEPLRRGLSGLWSRRITQEHRLVYGVTGKEVRFLQGRYHY